jgi:hypothetical protein
LRKRWSTIAADRRSTGVIEFVPEWFDYGLGLSGWFGGVIFLLFFVSIWRFVFGLDIWFSFSKTQTMMHAFVNTYNPN